MLTRRFALLGMPIVILAAVLLLGAYRYVVLVNLQSSTEDVAASMAQIFANTLWQDYEPLVRRAPTLSDDAIRADPLTQDLDNQVRRITRGTRVLKVKVYAPDGKTLYSNDPAQIGIDYSQRPLFRKALAGGIASNLTRREIFGALDGPVFDAVILESYVPARAPDDPSQIVAVMEIYSDITDLEGNILGRPEVRSAMLVIVVVLLFAFGVQLWVLRHAERRMAQEHAERMALVSDYAVAREADRAKSTFLANMSHELRTPLNAIMGFSEVLTLEAFGPIQQRRYVEYAADIHEAGRHLLQIIDDVLDLAKIEAGKVEIRHETVAVETVVASALDMLEPEALRFGVEIRRRFADALPAIVTDAGKLRQIVLNVASNAVKYTEGGSAVTVAVEPADGGSALRITVADTGIGMSPEELELALTPFGRVDGAMGGRRGGTGLGLPLTRRFVELLDGRFDIRSARGAGTTVTITLPLLPAD
jgi:two-component system cell cycle sensor histidine kinase PleC